MLKQFAVLYPNEAIVREAVRGCATYQLSWFDAHLWAYAECNGIPEIWSEAFNMTACMAPSARSIRLPSHSCIADITG